MKKQRPLIIIDAGSVFLKPGNAHEISVNNAFGEFLSILRETFSEEKYEYVFATNDLRRTRNGLIQMEFMRTMDRNHGFDYGVQISEFLHKRIRTWDDVVAKHAEIIISPDRSWMRRINHTFYVDPSYVTHDDFPEYFINGYEDAVNEKIWKDARIKIDELIDDTQAWQQKIMRDCEKIYQDPEDARKKIASLPDVRALIDNFGDCGSLDLDQSHPQDDVLYKIMGYFAKASTGTNKNEPGALRRDLQSIRSDLKNQFLKCNIDDAYPDATDRPLSREHRAVIDRALRAIHDIVRGEPRIAFP